LTPKAGYLPRRRRAGSAPAVPWAGMRPHPRIALLALAAVAALALAIAAILDRSSGRTAAPPASALSTTSGFDGAALPAPARARDFTLTDQSGQAVSLSRYQGQVTVLAFLYSTCGATCVLIAQQIRGALDEIAHPVPVLFVSVEPGADTPARVGRFLAQVSLTGRALYLTGSRASLQPIWRAYGVVLPTAGRVAFERSAAVLLLDRRGRERVIFGLEQLTPEGLAHDIGKLG
jgi:protein SCO1